MSLYREIRSLFIGLFLWSIFFAPLQAQIQDSVHVAEQALAFIQQPNPTFPPAKQEPMSADQIDDLGFEQVYSDSSVFFRARDGSKLHSKLYRANSTTTIVLLHGILSSSYTYNRMSGLLRKATGAEVIALDFRGHGKSEGRSGDVDYIDQYTNDLEDVIQAIRTEKPNQKIVLAGHSAGGGVALRYAQKNDAPEINGYLLFAPHLGHNAPTIPHRNESNPQPEDPFIKIHIQRIVGIEMMHSINRFEFDDQPVLFFNLPETMPLRSYTYRANRSLAPADYQQALQSVNKPLLVLVGSRDEAFIANEYKTPIEQYSDGDLSIIEGESHNGIRHNPNAMKRVQQWFDQLSNLGTN